MELKETTLSSQKIYTCPVFSVTEDVVRLPNGQETLRNRVHHNGGCGVLPLTDDGNVILVEQFRYGVGQGLLEIPAGKLEKGEDPIVCALRELREEVGAETDKLVDLGSIAVTPAYDSEIIYIYMAKCDRFVAQQLDDEFLKIHHVPFERAVEMVLKGAITDAKTQIALLKADKLLKDE